jgi:hypothetical protein
MHPVQPTDHTKEPPIEVVVPPIIKPATEKLEINTTFSIWDVTLAAMRDAMRRFSDGNL